MSLNTSKAVSIYANMHDLASFVNGMLLNIHIKAAFVCQNNRKSFFYTSQVSFRQIFVVQKLTCPALEQASLARNNCQLTICIMD